MGQIFNTVRPGDLIAADFMNQVIAELNSLESRVSVLEAGQPSGTAVIITSLVPAGTLQIGQDLQVIGKNFGFLSGAVRVTLDTTSVNAFNAGTSDQLLDFNIPNVPNVPPSGKLVVLSVSNGTTQASQTINLVPAPQPLQGNIDVLWQNTVTPNPNPNPIVLNQSAVFAYRLHSRANQTAVFTINPVISIATVQGSLQVLDANSNLLSTPQISVDPTQADTPFFIRVPLVPTSNPFTLRVTATSGTVSGLDPDRTFQVGVLVAPPDPNITLVFNNFTGINSAGTLDPSSSYSSTDNTIRVKQGTTGVMNFAVTFANAGSYDVTVQAGAGTTNWTVALYATPSQYVESAAGRSQTPQFSVQAQASASATGTVVFTIRQHGATASQTRSFNLALLS